MSTPSIQDLQNEAIAIADQHLIKAGLASYSSMRSNLWTLSVRMGITDPVAWCEGENASKAMGWEPPAVPRA